MKLQISLSSQYLTARKQISGRYHKNMDAFQKRLENVKATYKATTLKIKEERAKYLTQHRKDVRALDKKHGVPPIAKESK